MTKEYFTKYEAVTLAIEHEVIMVNTKSIAGLHALLNAAAEKVVGVQEGINTKNIITALERCVEAHYQIKHPFHNPIWDDAKLAIRELKILFASLSAAPSQPEQKAEPVAEYSNAELIYDSTKSLMELMKEAQEAVLSKAVFKKFIRGTPLENDIAVWMAEFAKETLCNAAQPAPNAEVERLREALDYLEKVITRQLELIAERAPGDYLDKRPMVQALQSHVKRIRAALAQRGNA